MPHISIGMLIGSNCPKALQPLNVVLTIHERGPFAVLYKHGWTVNGPLETKLKADTITCNHVMFNEVESIKETVLPNVVMRLFELNFNENS